MRRLALLAVIVVACGRPAPVTSPAPLTQLAYVSQIHHLSCEAAGLQMVLSHAGIERTQDQLLEQMGVDRQPPALGPDGGLRVAIEHQRLFTFCQFRRVDYNLAKLWELSSLAL